MLLKWWIFHSYVSFERVIIRLVLYFGILRGHPGGSNVCPRKPILTKDRGDMGGFNWMMLSDEQMSRG